MIILFSLIIGVLFGIIWAKLQLEADITEEMFWTEKKENDLANWRRFQVRQWIKKRWNKEFGWRNKS